MFTTETEVNRQLNFLDLNITRTQEGFKFKIYRKPTTCKALIPYDSNHHHSHKYAAFKAMFQRLLRIPMEKEDFDNELQTIIDLGKMNGYEKKNIMKIFKKEKKKLHPLYIPPVREQNQMWRTINYTDAGSPIVGNVFKRHSVKLAYRNTGTLLNKLKTKKQEQDILTRSGVYEIKCDDCEHFYIGETGRTIRERITEHRRTVTSAFGRHLHEYGHHSVDNGNIKILHNCNKGMKLTLLEAFEIWKKREQANLLNEQVDLGKEPLFKVVAFTHHRAR